MRNLLVIGASLLTVATAQNQQNSQVTVTPVASVINTANNVAVPAAATITTEKKPILFSAVRNEKITTEVGGELLYKDDKFVLEGVDLDSLPHDTLQLVTSSGGMLTVGEGPTEVVPGALLRLNPKKMTFVLVENGKDVKIPDGAFVLTPEGNRVMVTDTEAATISSKGKLVPKLFKAPPKPVAGAGATTASNPFAKVALASQNIKPAPDGRNFILQGAVTSSQTVTPASRRRLHHYGCNSGTSCTRAARQVTANPPSLATRPPLGGHISNPALSIPGENYFIDSSNTLHIVGGNSSPAPAIASPMSVEAPAAAMPLGYYPVSPPYQPQPVVIEMPAPMPAPLPEVRVSPPHDPTPVYVPTPAPIIRPSLSLDDLNRIKELERLAREKDALEAADRARAAELARRMGKQQAEADAARQKAIAERDAANLALEQADRGANDFVRANPQYADLESYMRRYRESRERHAEWVAEVARLESERSLTSGQSDRDTHRRHSDATKAKEFAERELTRARQSVIYSEKQLRKAEDDARKNGLIVDGNFNRFRNMMTSLDKASQRASTANMQAEMSTRKWEEMLKEADKLKADAEDLAKQHRMAIESADKWKKESVGHRSEIALIRSKLDRI